MEYGPMFFNSNLFTSNKRPMKFYLDGYSNQEVYHIATIIEAFGGKLAMPDASTIVFSEPGRLVTTTYSRFHIQYLRDSIVSMKLQDLEKYRMPLMKQESIDIASDPSLSPSLFDESVESAYTTSFVNLDFANPLLKPWKIVSVSTYANSGRRNSIESSDQLSESDGSSWTSSIDSEHSEYNNLTTRAKRIPTAYSAESHFSCIKRKRDESDPSDLANETDSSTQKKKRKIRRVRWSEEENRRLVQYLIDNDAVSKSKHLATFRQMESDRILTDPYRTATSIWVHFNQKLKFYISDYTDDVTALKEFKNLARRPRK